MKWSRSQGFTLVELVAMFVILGLLAVFGVPRLMDSVERSRAAEAFRYLALLRDAEERFLAREGVYTCDPRLLDVGLPVVRHFRISPITIEDTPPAPGWSCTLTRIADSSSRGEYTITFTQDGYDPRNSSLRSLPEIHPATPEPSDEVP